MPTIEQLCDRGVHGEVVRARDVPDAPGRVRDFLQAVADESIALHERFGWTMCGAWHTAMVNESECILVWSIPTWQQWAEVEDAQRADPTLAKWRDRSYELTTHQQRFLMVDAPLSPLRIGRQPARSDRDPGWAGPVAGSTRLRGT